MSDTVICDVLEEPVELCECPNCGEKYDPSKEYECPTCTEPGI